MHLSEKNSNKTGKLKADSGLTKFLVSDINIENPPERIVLDYSKIDDVEMHIDTHDAPDFTGCYVKTFTYGDSEATEAEVDVLNEDSDYVYEKALEQIY